MEILSCSLCVSRLVGALAPCRRSGARLAQWRPSVLSFPLVFSLCTCALQLNIHLDSSDRTQAISFKQVISTAPSSTFQQVFHVLCHYNSRFQQSASHNSVCRYIDTRSTECDSEVAASRFPRVVLCTMDHSSRPLAFRLICIVFQPYLDL